MPYTKAEPTVAKPEAKPAAKPATKPAAKPVNKTKVVAKNKTTPPIDNSLKGAPKANQLPDRLQKETYSNKPSGSSKQAPKKNSTVDGGLIGHAINQAMPGSTNKSSYRYPRVIEKVGGAAAGNPTPGSTANKLLPDVNNPIGQLLHWMSPKTTNAVR